MTRADAGHFEPHARRWAGGVRGLSGSLIYGWDCALSLKVRREWSRESPPSGQAKDGRNLFTSYLD